MRTDETLTAKISRGLRLGPALRVVWQSTPGLTLAGTVLLVFQGLLPLVGLYLMKLIIDGITGALAAPGQSGAFNKILLYILLAGLAALAANLCRSISELLKEAQSQIVVDRVSDVIHEKSVAVDLEYYENPKYHDTLHRAQQEATYRPIRILNSLMQLGQSGITFVALAGLLFAYHWAVAAILLAASLPGVVLRIRNAHLMYDWQRRRTQTERRAYYFHRVLTDSGHAKEIRLFGLGALMRGWFRDLRRKLLEERLRITRQRSASEMLAQTSATVAIFGTLAYVAYQALQGFITLGDLVMYYQAFQRAQGSFQEILTSLTGLYQDNLFLSDFHEFLSINPKIVRPTSPKPFPRPMREGIIFHDVNFQYPSGHGAALTDINLHLPPGKIVALVGENGSGKTTMVKLLCRLYDPTRGAVTIDGVDLKRFDPEALRREISVIFQDYVHYSLTARENIWLGDINLPAQDERIREAARRTGAEAVIEKLPRGYETILGHWFEEQGELSVGEWQRIALARTFLREAQVVILDEPTSWMDARGEYEVFQAVRDFLQGRTALLISHRFSTVRLADYIYVLNEGRITERGTHQELVELGGRYAHLYGLQAASYR